MDLPGYKDRAHAGHVLAELLKPRIDSDSIILAIPNGGVAVAVPIAKELMLPLSLLIVRKIQIPWNTEAGFGAVGSDGSVLLNDPLVRQLGLTEDQVRTQTEKALHSVRERLRVYGPDAAPPDLKGRTVILVDDGLASGVTMNTALRLVERRQPDKTIVAVPTCSRSAYHRIEPLTDEETRKLLDTLKPS
ncbi:MAG: phosphoribosyltransferase [Deltaproteobacteria bacterium]|nr:phosphoribosyltransferase [Deltaproteobacteria bacterium]